MQRIISVASSYKETTTIGFFGALIVFWVVGSSNPEKFTHLLTLLPILAAGPIIGGVITFCLRLLMTKFAQRDSRKRAGNGRALRSPRRRRNAFIIDLSPQEPK
jgi:hypothetical protein